MSVYVSLKKRALVLCVFLIACVMAMKITVKKVSAGPVNSLRISWTFYSYAQPDFNSKKLDMYGPQTVNIVENGKDGWVKISTYHGLQWVNTISKSGNSEKLLSVPLYSQRKEGLLSGCEIVSTAMMINYTKHVDINTLVSKMPLSNNPNIGYRGNVYSNGGGFTIYPSGLLTLVKSYLGSAVNMSTDAHKCTMDDIKRKIDEGHPVVAWVNGLSFNVHAICITGYNATGFYYNDPWTAQKNAFIKYDTFYAIWNKPIYDRLGYKNTPYCKALSY